MAIHSDPLVELQLLLVILLGIKGVQLDLLMLHLCHDLRRP